MIKRKFKELCFFHKKSNIKAGEGNTRGKFDFYTSSPLLSKSIDKAQFNNKGIIFGTGGKPSIHFAEGRYSVSTDCLVASSNQEDVNIKFTYYYLLCNFHLLEEGFRGAGLKHISKKYIEDLEIPIFTLETQNKIVTFLEKAEELIQKREKTIEMLDNLIVSKFFDMFGDLGDPENEEISYSLGDVCLDKNDIKCGPFGTQLSQSEFKTSGVPIWGIKHINSEFSIKTDEFVSELKAKKLMNYALYPRDILMTRKGTVGNCHIYPDNLVMGIMHSDILRIRVNEKIVNPFFLSFQFKHNKEVQWQINRISPGVVMSGINVSRLKKILVKVPDIDLQNSFENVYRKIEAHKVSLSTSLDNLMNLLNSLLQRGFSGQINVSEQIALESLLEHVDLDTDKNDIRDITNVYLRELVDKLNERDFEDLIQYRKAKKVAFQLLSSGDLTQRFNAINKSLELIINK